MKVEVNMKKHCKFCSSDIEIRRVRKRFWACRSCRSVIYAITKYPQIVEDVWPLFHDHAILPQVRRIKIPWNSDVPDELEAKRYRTQDRDNNHWYIIVSEYGDMPVEVFTSTAGDNDHGLQPSIANLTALTRLISLMLRHVFLGERITIDKIKKQLKRSSRQKNDLPSMVLHVLDKYEDKSQNHVEKEEQTG